MQYSLTALTPRDVNPSIRVKIGSRHARFLCRHRNRGGMSRTYGTVEVVGFKLTNS